MLILGIETSCDETSAAVVEETGDAARPWAIRSNVVASQVQIHREWGGVVPELASRQHIRDICGVVDRSLEESQSKWADLGADRVSPRDWVLSVSLVGVSFARLPPRPPGVARRRSSSGWSHRIVVLQNGEDAPCVPVVSVGIPASHWSWPAGH
jgi:hypothetical protein